MCALTDPNESISLGSLATYAFSVYVQKLIENKRNGRHKSTRMFNSLCEEFVPVVAESLIAGVGLLKQADDLIGLSR